MTEIAALPWNGYTVASTFSGCGGSSLGYRMAGFKVLWASEFVEAARTCYVANKAPHTIVDGRDIRNVTAGEVLAAMGLREGELDLLDGSPPCASFSTAGKRAKGWGQVKKYSDTQQRTDDLFFEYVRILRGIKPRTFVAENVSGLVKGVAKGYFLEILRELKGCGYRVCCRVLDAQWLGVPQARQRTIFVGVREDLGIEPAHPKPLPYRYSVQEALPWICKAVHDTVGQYSMGDVTHRADCTVDTNPRFFVEAESDMTRYEVGAEWDKMGKPGTQSKRYFNLIRPALDKPCGTVSASGGHPSIASVAHPTERRKFSIAELKRICAFPDDFVVTGTYAQQWERLGRAVPPVMMFHVARTVRDEVLRARR